MLQRRFREKFGYDANFLRPSTYPEKVQYRKLWGNHAFYASVADKYGVRRYVAERAGERYLIPLLGVYDHLTEADFETLPERFVIKATHGSRWNKVVWNKTELDVPGTVAWFNDILRQTYGVKDGEYHYSLIEPKIVIEELLVDNGGPPYNFDLFCYNSPAGFDYAVTVARPVRADGSVHFDKHWNLLEGELREGEADRIVNPENFDEMLEVAKALSRDFDFVRIDLYNVEGAIYFGEITATPAAGMRPVTNARRAAMRNEMWKLDVDNRRLYRKPWARRLGFFRNA